MLQSTECFHTVHLSCFKKAAFDALMKKQFLYCPECKQPLQEAELKKYLSKEELKEIDDSQFKSFIQDQNNLVTCPCGNVMEVQPGDVDLEAKDDNG